MKELLTKPYTDLSYEELTLLQSFCVSPEFYRLKDAKYVEFRKNSKVVQAARREYRERVKAKEASEAPDLAAFTKKHVKPGDLVMFKGTRSSATREVSKVGESTIIGLVVNLRRTPEGFKRTYTGYSSENSIDNLKAYFDSESGTWRDKKWIIEKSKI